MDRTEDACFCCGRQLRPSFDQPRPGGKAIGAIDGGLFFRATGNYGSELFDPRDEQYLEIVICDPCVAERQARLVHWAEPGADPQAPPYRLREPQEPRS